MAVVLVVEDNAGLRSVVCRHLARRGHTPVPAATGAEALRRATRRSPSIALLDLRLPDTDGLRLFTELRRDRPGIVGVIMTAYASVPSAVECLHRGISEYIPKPFNLDALVVLIERLTAVAWPIGAESARRSIAVPSHQRLAHALVCEIEDLASITSFPAWGRAAGGAESTVRSWCNAAGVSPKASEDFRRGLVATTAAVGTGIRPRDLLGYKDARSIKRFLTRCGPLEENGRPWTPGEYCRKQQVLKHPAVVDEVVRLLRQRGIIKDV